MFVHFAHDRLGVVEWTREEREQAHATHTAHHDQIGAQTRFDRVQTCVLVERADHEQVDERGEKAESRDGDECVF